METPQSFEDFLDAGQTPTDTAPVSAHEVWVWLNRANSAYTLSLGGAAPGFHHIAAICEAAYLIFFPRLDFRAQASAYLLAMAPAHPATVDEGIAFLAEYIAEYWRIARLDDPSPARQRECLAKIAAYAYRTYERDSTGRPHSLLPPQPKGVAA